MEQIYVLSHGSHIYRNGNADGYGHYPYSAFKAKSTALMEFNARVEAMREKYGDRVVVEDNPLSPTVAHCWVEPSNNERLENLPFYILNSVEIHNRDWVKQTINWGGFKFRN